jgi:hypothetical protein
VYDYPGNRDEASFLYFSQRWIFPASRWFLLMTKPWSL